MARQLGGVVHAASLFDAVRDAQERLVLAREEERRRLRRDLHDGLGPALASLTLQVDTLRNRLGKLQSRPDLDLDAELLTVRAGIQSTVLDVRRIVEGLRPPALDELGLEAAIEQLGDRLTRGARLVVDVTVSELPPIPAAVEVAIYRVAQEALTNIVHHAVATRASVRVALADREITLEITDNGSGRVTARPGGVGPDQHARARRRDQRDPAHPCLAGQGNNRGDVVATGRARHADTGGRDVITVLIVDDHPLFREGLAGLLATVADVEVVGSVGDGETAVRRTVELRPDVVLMDLNLPGVPGLEATRRIIASEVNAAVLVLTMVDDDDSVMAALQVGARGYVLKGAAQEEVLAAIRAVAAGGAVFGAGVAERVLSGGRTTGGNQDLTAREAQVLALIAQGRSNPEIARKPGVSLKTVQNHVSHVLTKMQVSDRTQAALRMRGL